MEQGTGSPKTWIESVSFVDIITARMIRNNDFVIAKSNNDYDEHIIYQIT